jgi:CBS domain-containing protein
MEKRTATRERRTIPLDRSIERMRRQLGKLAPFLAKGKGQTASTLEECDAETERLITEVFGESSEMLEAYAYAQFGDASGLVNLTDEAPEGGGQDSERQSLMQRNRVLESCIAELEARRAAVAKKPQPGPQVLIGPQILDHMSPEIRSVNVNDTLKEASQRMQQWKIGSLLVSDNRYYVGLITDTDLAREVVARGLDASATAVKSCMRTPLVTIEATEPIIEAVRMMKDSATRHLAVSNILRYYSGVA